LKALETHPAILQLQRWPEHLIENLPGKIWKPQGCFDGCHFCQTRGKSVESGHRAAPQAALVEIQENVPMTGDFRHFWIGKVDLHLSWDDDASTRRVDQSVANVHVISSLATMSRVSKASASP
jgi:hypothetical protein